MAIIHTDITRFDESVTLQATPENLLFALSTAEIVAHEHTIRMRAAATAAFVMQRFVSKRRGNPASFTYLVTVEGVVLRQEILNYAVPGFNILIGQAALQITAAFVLSVLYSNLITDFYNLAAQSEVATFTENPTDRARLQAQIVSQVLGVGQLGGQLQQGTTFAL